ncbi:transposase [Arachidicoccus ginsenosidivorans]|uniref:Transposase n=1 Tax=Arachidicoccus ginsenosidivorans TaxID=496057 RepID=A0A5B8VGY4_9BACT|nr:transposase [Arachidicoccus ginsenosidivorans]QEC70867.1 transposase [Arachidicoccus ginsenosidivorans]
MKKINSAFNKAMSFVSARIDQVSEFTKPQKKFLKWIIEIWVMLPVRHNFLNVYRYSNGQYSEKSLRNQFERKIDFPALSDSVFSPLKEKECIVAFDPSFIKKSGKKTYGKGYYWSGKDGQTLPGLEISSLALVDVSDETAYSLEAVQPPAGLKDGKQMEHYVNIIGQNKDRILKYTKYVAADAYFMKTGFIEPLLKMGIQVVTRMRQDADLKYLHKGPQKSGKGRNRIFDGKVDVKNIDKRRWEVCYQDEDVCAYESVVWCVSLKRIVKVVYLKYKKTDSYSILLSTDTELGGEKVLQYYRLRFQIEFLLRDAKQYTGLEECQARSQTKLYNHFNLSLMAVSLMKLTCWATQQNKSQIPFSMRRIKTWYYNKYITETIFSNLGIDVRPVKVCF